MTRRRKITRTDPCLLPPFEDKKQSWWREVVRQAEERCQNETAPEEATPARLPLPRKK